MRLFINHIRVTTDEGDGRVAGGVHHFHLTWFDDAGFSHQVNILLLHRIQDDLVARLEFIQVTEDLAEDIVMPGQHHIAILAGVGRTDVLTNTFFQLLPTIALDNRPILDANCRNVDLDSLLRSRAWAPAGSPGIAPAGAGVPGSPPR